MCSLPAPKDYSYAYHYYHHYHHHDHYQYQDHNHDYYLLLLLGRTRACVALWVFDPRQMHQSISSYSAYLER